MEFVNIGKYEEEQRWTEHVSELLNKPTTKETPFYIRN